MCLGWDSVRRAVDMVEVRVELVGVEFAQFDRRLCCLHKKRGSLTIYGAHSKD